MSASPGLAQIYSFAPAPLDDIAAAIERADASYFDRNFAYLQRSDNSRISGSDLVQTIAGCTVSKMDEGDMGLAIMSLDCPGRVPSGDCYTSGQQLMVLSRRDRTFAIEVSETRLSEDSCLIAPPAGGA